MGRPLKIAKAQAVINVTNTTATTNIVTVSQDLLDPTSAAYGVIAGMPFVPSVTTGTNLIAGTTYYILQITGNSTFTVSDTQLSANPTYTPVTLTTGTTASALSVGVVDSGFNNPEGLANTYGVVGGNTAIYGNQVLARVAIGQAGQGNIYSVTTSADVWGVGADFANNISVGDAIQLVNSSNGATTDIGFVSSLYYTDALITDTSASTSYITANSTAGFNSNTPIVFDSNIGGLVANRAYFVKVIDGGGTLFTVSGVPGGPNVALTTTTGQSVTAVQEAVTLVTNATANSLVGVDYMSPYNFATNEAGFILRQKGKQKYLVQGASTGLVSQCLTANLANAALVPNSMSILATYANSATQYVQSLSDIDSELFTANSGPIASGNIVLADADPVYVTFNTAVAANTANGLYYPLVQIPGA